MSKKTLVGDILYFILHMYAMFLFYSAEIYLIYIPAIFSRNLIVIIFYLNFF